MAGFGPPTLAEHPTNYGYAKLGRCLCRVVDLSDGIFGHDGWRHYQRLIRIGHMDSPHRNNVSCFGFDSLTSQECTNTTDQRHTQQHDTGGKLLVRRPWFGTGIHSNLYRFVRIRIHEARFITSFEYRLAYLTYRYNHHNEHPHRNQRKYVPTT